MAVVAAPGVVPDRAYEGRPGEAGGRFLGRERDYLRILTRGAVFLLITLGIYRFWLVTDTRRFLWANTEIAGNGLEYNGTARELLIGFLIAIVLLVPVNAALFLATLGYGVIGRMAGLIGFLVLAVLGQFAVYRARRYRLTRTVYRGLRFRQTGSAWRYAVLALIWWAVIAATLGLAYPFAQASLERYKMRNTYYGDLPGHFEGSAFGLFFRGLLMWLIVMGPFLVGLALSVMSIDWPAIVEAVGRGGDNVMDRIESASPNLGQVVAVAVTLFGWSVFSAGALYPVFQAMVLRWWLSGLRFGSVTVSSSLRTGQVYGAYLLFLFYGAIIGLGAAVAGVIGYLITYHSSQNFDPKTAEIVGTVVVIAIYVVTALCYSTLYQATVKLRLWRLGVESLLLTGVGALERVKAVGEASSPVGEGLADALHVGSI